MKRIFTALTVAAMSLAATAQNTTLMSFLSFHSPFPSKTLLFIAYYSSTFSNISLPTPHNGQTKGSEQKTLRFFPEWVPAAAFTLGVGHQGRDQFQNVLLAVDVGKGVIAVSYTHLACGGCVCFGLRLWQRGE